ncbi:MAG: IF-2-associated domain-containing protein, partial [Serpentinimonas sp.]|nr:IF-2-associated domain-containing protein [Serpentinimonas sp.]
MTSKTVADFAAELKQPTALLLEQLGGAGVLKQSGADPISDSDKQRLLGFLQASHGTASAERKKITLTKKSTSEIKQADASGRARTIQVEVRKKRTFVRRDDDPVGSPSAAEEPVAEVDEAAEAISHQAQQAELERLEEQARHQAEQIRLQEEELARQRLERQQQQERDAQEQQAALELERQSQLALQRARAEQEVQQSRQRGAKPSTAPLPEPAAAPAAELLTRQAAELASKQAAELAAKQAAELAAEQAAAQRLVDEHRARDLDQRRQKALAEAQAIRDMMAAPKKVLLAKKPEEPKPAPPAEAKPGLKGTLHKPAGTPAPAKPGAAKPAAPGAAAAGAGKKEVKSEALSSTWKDEAAKKKEVKGRGGNTSAVRSSGTAWRASSKGGRRGSGGRDDRTHSFASAQAETKVIEVHVPETIT